MRSIFFLTSLLLLPFIGSDAAITKDARDKVAVHLESMAGNTPPQTSFSLPTDLSWFNSDPLEVESDLKGKLIVLCFWSYSNVDCIQMVQELEELQDVFRNRPVAFLGIHSGRGYNDKFPENVEKALKTLNVRHRVINDPYMRVWRSLGASCWPTTTILAPSGQIIHTACGSGHKDHLEMFLETALLFYDKELDDSPLPAVACAQPDSIVPSKLTVDPTNKHLYISDSANHRILVTSLGGEFLHCIGSGHPGFWDGPREKASFHHPQGLIVYNDKLYVADSHNHAIRVFDFKTEEVTTLTGTGSCGCDLKGGKTGTEQELCYPWDLEIARGHLFVSMAGSHQIWTVDLKSGTASNFSGTGEQRNHNTTMPGNASWAQPAGISLGGNTLYVADSESNTIRSINLIKGATHTLVGGDPRDKDNLFAMGDRDGKGSHAKLQYPLAVLWLDRLKKLLVADTFNHRIKVVDPEEDSIKTVAGTGRHGTKDGRADEASFNEPSGLAVHPDGDKVFVADKNNGSVRLLDLESDEVQTISLAVVPRPIPRQPEPLVSSKFATRLETNTIRRGAGDEGHIVLQLLFPEKHHITEQAPNRWQIRQEETFPIDIAKEHLSGTIPSDGKIRIPYKAVQNGSAHLEALVYYCKDNAACMMEEIDVKLNFAEGTESREETVVRYNLPAAQQ